jgi:hypothetical protein
MSRFTPVARITLDGQALTAPEAALLRAEVTLGMGPAHDRCCLELHALSRNLPSPGGEVAVALGFDGEPENVFTGSAVRVERRPQGAWVECFAPSWKLAQRRAAQAWVGQGATQIVNDMLGDAGVDAGIVGADLDVAVFHADDRRSRWAHLVRLARLAGCDVVSTPVGALDVRPPKTGPASATLRRGAELIAWRAADVEPGPTLPPVGPAGAASEAGAEQWHLPLASPAGDTPEREAFVTGALRDRNSVRSAGQARTDAAARRTVQGEALCWGQPRLRPGDLIRLADLPDGDIDARITAVTQVLDADGFSTWIDFEGST